MRSAEVRAPRSAGVPPVPDVGRGWHSRRYLPHLDEPGLVQMITFRLADSLPASVLAEIHEYTKDNVIRRARVEDALDAGHGACLLGDARVAGIVRNALLHFDGERYRLLAWVVMPNHVHVLIETIAGHPLETIIHSWKSFTAKTANKLLGRAGPFWQAEYFDRAIRNEHHLREGIQYIEQNPCKSGLVSRPEEWLFGSAASAGPALGTGGTPALREAKAGLASRPEDWLFGSAASAGPAPGRGGTPALRETEAPARRGIRPRHAGARVEGAT